MSTSCDRPPFIIIINVVVFATCMKQWQTNTIRKEFPFQWNFDSKQSKRDCWLVLYFAHLDATYLRTVYLWITITMHGFVFVFIFSLRLLESSFSVYEFIRCFCRSM